MPERQFSLRVNGTSANVATDEDRPLLDVLREDLHLTGTKYGCGEGECGACTVLADGEAIRSCITTLGEVAGREITTIEHLAPKGELHPVQRAFLEKQAMQCGYCVPGQILSAVALLKANPQPTRDEIIAAMNGNLCRCCNYANILAAVEQAAGVSP
jgi:aerobic-type carbon monoxide dehydrogenase small subunit (CoxS/CutS family)